MKKLLLSFSGGETSAYMVQWCLANLSHKYEMIVVFANTGDEREETLEFVKKCDDILNFNTVWVEADVQKEMGVGTQYKIVTFESASRKGEPFDDIIKKYGMPNPQAPFCTRELKAVPIKKYAQSLGWDKYYTAIGIRIDEFDRMNDEAEKKRFIYPLIELNPKTKIEINSYWHDMPFRLELKGYEGNCKACYKKSDRKLMTIAKNTPESFDVFKRLQDKYENYLPDSKKHHEDKLPLRFFRGEKTVEDIMELSKQPFIEAVDDSKKVNFQLRIFDPELDVGSGCEESCEPFN